jgi:hypothetical protein
MRVNEKAARNRPGKRSHREQARNPRTISNAVCNAANPDECEREDGQHVSKMIRKASLRARDEVLSEVVFF